jgi:hypothetical protein
MMEDQMVREISITVDPIAVVQGGTVKLKAELSPEEIAILGNGGRITFAELGGAAIGITNQPEMTWYPPTRGARYVMAHLRDKTNNLIGVGQTIVYVFETYDITHVVPAAAVQEGNPVDLQTKPTNKTDEDLSNEGVHAEWLVDQRRIDVTRTGPFTATWDTSLTKPGSRSLTGQLVDRKGAVLITKSDAVRIDSRPLARTDTLSVALQRSTTPHTRDQVVWSIIRDTTTRLQFSGSGYQDFIDRVLGQGPVPPGLPGGAWLSAQASDVAPFVYGTGAFDLLKTATQVFLLLEAGVVSINDPRSPYPHQLQFDADEESGRLGALVTRDTIRDQLASYLGGSNNRLPYLDRVIRVAFPDDASRPYASTFYSYGLLRARATNPSLIELIWSYWHEEGMLVQTMAAISRRFQNMRGPGDRDPLAHLEIDPLRPLNNLLWGYIQDEWNRLTLQRRAYEYDHHYGLSMYGKAVPTPRTADTRSKFVEAFHHLLHLCSIFYKEDNDTTVIADGFPLLNALKEVHLLLAQGAHNQFGDLPWTARCEMLIQQWLLARPEMREFLQSRPMVPYKEAWMPQVDTMKTLQGWSDVTVTHFRDLGVYGEQILLSIRYGDWIGINDENSAKNWARYWRPEVQGYLHAYRAVTGVDLTNPDTVDTTMPAIHLQKRLPMQRIH